jgi:hypothetical protein
MNLHRPISDLVIPYSKSGNEEYSLAKWLMDQQNCWENLDALKETFMLKMVILEMMEETDDVKTLCELTHDVTLCEFMIQKLFRFSEDFKYHRFWEYPKCQCPKIDNIDIYPSESGYIIDSRCVLHGRNVEEE